MTAILTIQGARVHIDGEDLSNRHYVNCLLVYSGGDPPNLSNTSFTTCEWEFMGGAANTVQMLQDFYQHEGLRSFVQNIMLAGALSEPISEGKSNGGD